MGRGENVSRLITECQTPDGPLTVAAQSDMHVRRPAVVNPAPVALAPNGFRK